MLLLTKFYQSFIFILNITNFIKDLPKLYHLFDFLIFLNLKNFDYFKFTILFPFANPNYFLQIKKKK